MKILSVVLIMKIRNQSTLLTSYKRYVKITRVYTILSASYQTHIYGLRFVCDIYSYVYKKNHP